MYTVIKAVRRVRTNITFFLHKNIAKITNSLYSYLHILLKCSCGYNTRIHCNTHISTNWDVLGNFLNDEL